MKLSDYKIEIDSNLHLVLRQRGSAEMRIPNLITGRGYHF